MPIYNLNNKRYNIPDDVVADFERDNPEAIVSYSSGDKVYDIPVNKRDKFLKRFPDAKPYTDSPTESSKPYNHEYDENMNLVGGAAYEDITQGSSKPDPKVQKHILENKPDMFKSKTVDMYGAHDKDKNEFDLMNEGKLYQMKAMRAASTIGEQLNERIKANEEALNQARRKQAEGNLQSSSNNKGRYSSAGLGGTIEERQEAYEKRYGKSPSRAELTKMDDDVANLLAEQEYLKESKKVFDAAKNDAGFFKGMKDAVDASYLSFGLTDRMSAERIQAVQQKLESGQTLSDSEQSLLTSLGLQQMVNEQYNDMLGRWYKAGMVTADMAPFMAEMYFNPMSGFGKLAMKTAVKKFGEKGAKAIAAKVLSRTIGDVAGAAGMAATTGMPSVAADAMERQRGYVTTEVGEKGTIKGVGFEGGEDASDAWRKAFTARTIENWSEMVGEYFSPIGKVVGKGFTKAFDKMGLSKVNDFIDNINSSEWVKLLDDFSEQTQWNGPLGEFAEEQVGMIANAALVGDTKWNDITDLDKQLDVALGVGVFGTVMSLLRIGGYRTPKYRARKAVEGAEKEGLKVCGEELWGTIKFNIDNSSDEELGNTLAVTIAATGANQEQAEAAFKYANALKAQQAVNTVKEKAKIDMPGDFEVEAEAAYDEGAELQTPYDKHGAMQEAKRAEAALGDDAAFAQSVINGLGTPVATINAMAESGKYTGEQIQKAKDYYSAMNRMNGMTDALLDEVDSQIESANVEVDMNTNKELNQVIQVVLRDGRIGYVVQGTVVGGEKGVIDVAHSDKDIVVRLEDGESKFMNPNKDLQSIAWIDSPAKLKENNNTVLRQSLIDKGIQEIDWNPATPNPKVGDSFEMDGVPVTIVSLDGNGGMFVAPTEEYQAAVGNESKMQQLIAKAQQMGVVQNGVFKQWASDQLDAQEEVATEEAVAEEVAAEVQAAEEVQAVEEAAPVEEKRPMTEDEAAEFIFKMERNAVEAPEIELTPENWIAEFGENGLVETPIGQVKFGQNQYVKLQQMGRNGKLGMIKPTLTNPDIIIEDKRPSKNGEAERDFSYVFIKAFTGKDGKRMYYFTSVTVKKDGSEVVISNQEKSINKISKLLQNGNVAWTNSLFSSHPTTQIEESVPLNDSNKPTSTDNQPALLGINSSELSINKDNEQNVQSQEKKQKPLHEREKEEVFRELGEKYGEKMPHKVAVTAKAFADDLKKAQEKLAKAEEALDNAPIGREQKQEAARDKAKAEYEAVKREADFWAEMDAEIKEARMRRDEIVNPQAQIETSNEPMTADEFIAQQLAVGNIVLNKDNYKTETGFGDEEANALNGGTKKLLSTEGMTIEEAGERLMEMDRENGTNFFDQSDANAGRDALISLLGSVKSRKELNDYIANNRAEQVKRESEALRNEVDKFIRDNFHMTPEEYATALEVEMQNNPYEGVDLDAIDAIFAEAEEQLLNEQENESEGNVDGNSGESELLYEEQAGEPSGDNASKAVEQAERAGSGTQNEGENAQASQPSEVSKPQIADVFAAAEQIDAEEKRRRPLRARANEWAKALGVKVHFIERVEDVKSANVLAALKNGEKVAGWYSRATGEVFFLMPNLDNENEVDNTYVHEVVAHKGMFEMLGKERYDSLCDKVWEMMPKSEQDKFIDYPGVNGNTRIAADEYIAHLSESMNLTPEQQSIWDKIVQFFRELFDQKLNGILSKSNITNEDISNLIKASYANLKSGANEGFVGEGTRFSVKYTEEEKAIIDKAKANGTYMKAPNGEPTNLTEKQWAQVRTKAFKKWFGEWEKPFRIEKLRNSDYAKIEGDEISKGELTKKEAFEYGKKIQKEYKNKDTGSMIQLQRGRKNGGLNEILQHNYKDQEHLKSIAAIPQIIEKSIYIQSEENKDKAKNPDVVEYQQYVCGLKIGSEDYTVLSLVAVDSKGNRYYDHNLTRIEKTKLLDLIKDQAVKVEDFGTTPDTESTILSGYKAKKLISVLQVNYSKIVDKNGEPLVVRHRTPNEFTEFDKEKIGSSTDYGAFGLGFYFSPSDFGAWNYGQNMIEAFLNIKKPFLLNSSNAYDIKEPFYGENYKWGKEQSEKFTEWIKENGYDGVHYDYDGKHDEMVAFEPNQIKSATDNVGTFDADNPDIRYRVVYHGSGAEFDKFDHSFMGTGEGAQAYGWGTYVTEVDGIARRYATAGAAYKISEMAEDESLIKSISLSEKAVINIANEMFHTNQNFEETKQELLDSFNGYKLTKKDKLYKEAINNTLEEDVKNYVKRHLYEVEIPDNDGTNYIAWDKMLPKEHADRIKKAVRESDFFKAYKKEYGNLAEERLEAWTKTSGGRAYKLLGNFTWMDNGADKRISEMLHDAGFVGIEYPTNYMSGGNEDGTKNYVIFNEDDLQIVEHTRFRTVNEPARAYITESEANDIMDVPQSKVRYTKDNIASELYKTTGNHLRELYKGGVLGRVLIGEYAEIDQFKAKADYDKAKTHLGALLKDLVEMKHQATDAAQEVINGVIRDAEYSLNYYHDLAMGKDVWRTQDAPRFRVTNKNQEIFVGNAAKAVEGIKQEKATPQQWLAMIEKNGGLKTGEDKWLGLSDWLKASDAKTLTKGEVLDFINQNKIVIEEVKYGEGGSIDSLREKYPRWDEAFEVDDDYGSTAVSLYNDENAAEIYNTANPDSKVDLKVGSGGYKFMDIEDEERVVAWAREQLTSVNPINSTRLDYTTKGLENKQEIALTIPTIEPWSQSDEIHFGDAGNGRAVVWMRFGETTIEDKELAEKSKILGSKEWWNMSDEERKAVKDELKELKQNSKPTRVLVIDEIQSKRHQEGREKGYRNVDAENKLEEFKKQLRGKYPEGYSAPSVTEEQHERILRYYPNTAWLTEEERSEYISLQKEAGSKTGVPEAPFEKNWSELAMKRMLRYAAENGFDKVAWTTGTQQAERYSLGHVVDDIWHMSEKYHFNLNKDGYSIGSVRTNKEGVITWGNRIFEDYEGENIADFVGKELAIQMLSSKPKDKIQVNGLVGGEGMKGFYDKMLPSFVNKYVKKWGTKVQDIELPNVEEAGRIMHSVDVTDAMKESVMEGQTMFRVVEQKRKDIQQAVDEFTSKYNSKPVFLIDSDMTDKELEAVFDGKATAKELREALNKPNAMGGYINNVDKIVIFADKAKVEKMENILFHENLHALASTGKYDKFISYLYEFGKDNEAFARWKKMADREEYKEYQRPEEFFAYVITDGMERGDLEELKMVLNPSMQKSLFNLLKESGYEYEEESRRRRLDGQLSEERSSEVRTERTVREKDSGRKEAESRRKSGRERAEELKQLFDKVADMGLQGVLGNQEYNQLMYDIFRSMPKDVHSEISVNAVSKLNMDVAKAVSDYLATNSNPSVWEKVLGFVRDALRKVGFDLELTPNDVKYLLWRSQKKLDKKSVFDVAEDIAKQNELKVGDSEVRFSVKPAPFDPSDKRNEIVKEYDAFLKKGKFNFIEAFQDRMYSVKVFMDMIVDATGKKVRDFEDAYEAENQLGSINKPAEEKYLKNFYKPLVEAVKALSDKWGTEAVEKYIYCKSGLERCEVLRQRDADEAYNEAKAELDDKLAKGQLTQPQYDALLQQADDQRQKTLSEDVDYAGIRGLMYNEKAKAINKEFEQGRIDKKTRDTRLAYLEANRKTVTQGWKQFAETQVAAIEKNADAAELDALWKKIKAATNETLRMDYESGMIDKATYDAEKKMMKYYVPLRNWADTTAEEMYEYRSELVRPVSSNQKRAKGRESQADNPIATIALMAQNAIVRGNRNKVKQKFYAFVANRETGLASVRDVWYVKDAATGDWIPKYADTSKAKDAEEFAQILDDFEQQMKLKEEQGNAYKGKLPFGMKFRANRQQKQSHVVPVMINGKEYAVYVNGNPRPAQAINGETNSEAANASAWYDKIKRIYGAGLTSWNPDFIIPNMIRDGIHASTMTFLDAGPWAAIKFAANGPRVFSQVFAMVSGAGKGLVDPKYQAYFEEFVANGGETGYTAIHTLEDYKKEYDKLMKEVKGLKGNILKNGFGAAAKWLEAANRIFEDVNRFNAYVSARESGESIVRSVSAAKNITVNFNRKGALSANNTAFGTIANAMSKWILFFNPAVQGLAQLVTKTKENKGRATMMAATILASGFFMPMLNEMLVAANGGDDEDDYWNQSDFKRRNNWLLFTGDGYVSVPLPPVLRELYGIGDIIYGSITGHITPQRAVMDMARQVQSAIGFVNLIPEVSQEPDMVTWAKGFAPDIAAPVLDVISNTNFMGRPIAKWTDYNKYIPEYERVYKGVSPQWSELSKLLNKVGGGEGRRSDVWGNFINPAMMEHLFTNYGGGIGKTINNVVGMSIDAMQGNTENMDPYRKSPIAPRFYIPNDEKTVVPAINRKYYDYDYMYNVAKKALKNYQEGVRTKKHPEYQKYIEEMKQNGEMEFIQFFDRESKRLTKMQNLLKGEPTNKKGLEEKIIDLKAEIATRCYEMLK